MNLTFSRIDYERTEAIKKSGFSEEQIVGMLKRHEAGLRTADVCREHGLSTATFYGWKQKFGEMYVAEAQRPEGTGGREPPVEASLVAELSLHGEALKGVIRKNGWSELAGLRGDVAFVSGRVPAKRARGLQAAVHGVVERSL